MKYQLKSHCFPCPWGGSLNGYYRENTNDGGALISCIEQDEYKLVKHNLGKGHIAIDIGAHIGAVTLAMASRGIRVFSVEPIPENYIILQSNILSNSLDGLVKIYNCAISSNMNNKFPIYYTSDISSHGSIHHFIGSSLLQSKVTSLYKEGECIQVDPITIEQIFIENNLERCDFLKIDCEGGEWEAFKSISSKILDRINIISGELHTQDKKKSVKHEDLLPLLLDKFEDITEDFEKDYCTPGEVTHFIYKNKRLL